MLRYGPASILAGRPILWPLPERAVAHLIGDRSGIRSWPLVPDLHPWLRHGQSHGSPPDWAVLRKAALKFARLWCRSTAHAEDIAHDALAALLGQTGEVGDPAAYLFIVVKRIALRANRKKRRFPFPPCRTSATSIDNAETAYLYRQIADCPRLSARDRRVLMLSAEGYTQTEIAERLGVHRGAVAQYVARARTKLTGTG